MKLKKAIIAFFSIVFILSVLANVAHLLNSTFLTLKWESMIRWGDINDVNISIREMSVPFIAYRRILGLPFRSRERVGADFAALLLKSEGFYPDKVYEASSECTIQIDFAEKAPNRIVVYNYTINSYGMDRKPFFMKDGGVLKTKYTVNDNSTVFQFVLNSYSSSPLNSNYEAIVYRGVRVLCEFRGHTMEYVFAFRAGVPIEIDVETIERINDNIEN